MRTTREVAEKVDRRKDGLSTKGYPLREIVSRENGVYVLSCGHVRPDPVKGYPVRSRRCPECAGTDLPIYTQHQLDRIVANEREQLARIAELAFTPAHAYASENADRYHVFDDGQRAVIKKIVAAIREGSHENALERRHPVMQLKEIYACDKCDLCEDHHQ